MRKLVCMLFVCVVKFFIQEKEYGRQEKSMTGGDLCVA